METGVAVFVRWIGYSIHFRYIPTVSPPAPLNLLVQSTDTLDDRFRNSSQLEEGHFLNKTADYGQSFLWRLRTTMSNLVNAGQQRGR